MSDIQLLHLSRRAMLNGGLIAGLGLVLPWRTASAEASPAERAGACMMTADVTQGPYYFDPKLVRRDVTEGKPGSPLLVSVGVVEASCSPIGQARVDIWHCDAEGHYSGYANAPTPGAPGGGRGFGPPPGGRPQQRADTSVHFLRGTQFTDAKGEVEFATIYPGWYPGRTTHIHLKVYLGDDDVLTSQLFFPDALSDRIYGHPPYKAGRDSTNATDDIAREQGASGLGVVTDEGAGHRVRLVLGVDRSARSTDHGPGGPPPRRG